jgi:uncharacterized protein DUF6894
LIAQMPDYRFTIHGDSAPEPVTVTLPDDGAAWEYGESLARFLLRELKAERETWIMEIRQANREIATIGFDLAALRKPRPIQ